MLQQTLKFVMERHSQGNQSVAAKAMDVRCRQETKAAELKCCFADGFTVHLNFSFYIRYDENILADFLI